MIAIEYWSSECLRALSLNQRLKRSSPCCSWRAYVDAFDRTGVTTPTRWLARLPNWGLSWTWPDRLQRRGEGVQLAWRQALAPVFPGSSSRWASRRRRTPRLTRGTTCRQKTVTSLGTGSRPITAPRPAIAQGQEKHTWCISYRQCNDSDHNTW